MSAELLADKLTILLTLKGREEFTLRWLKYAQKTEIDCKIIIADGGNNKKIKSQINEGLYGNLNIIYLEFPEDVSFQDYYLKIQKSLKLIDTPYYIMADNDDFYSYDALIYAVKILENDNTCVAASGLAISFKILDGKVYGKKIRFCTSKFVSFEEESSKERLRGFFDGAPGNYYSVIKTEVGLSLWDEICRLNFYDIRMPELLIELGLLSSGKVVRFNVPFYYRQIGLDVGNEAGLSHDFFDEILTKSWSSEINSLCDFIVRLNNGRVSRDYLRNGIKAHIIPRVLNSINFDQYLLNTYKIKKGVFSKSLQVNGWVNFIFKYILDKLYSNRSYLSKESIVVKRFLGRQSFE